MPTRRAVLLGALLGTVTPHGQGVWAADRPEREPLTALEREDRDHLLVVVTKTQPLTPKAYAPPDLVPWRDPAYEMRAEVAEHLEVLFEAAETEQLGLRVISGYRSYETQRGTYASWVGLHGLASAEATSARAGHSEHQTGLAVDLDSTRGKCYLDDCFGETAEGRWVAQNAYRFGFVLSYPKGYRDRTGYAYEPWHIRYVGPRTAGVMHDRGLVLLDEYLAATRGRSSGALRLGRGNRWPV